MNGMGGDFNVFAATPGAPGGSNYGEMRTNGGAGDVLFVTKISPALPLPLPIEDRKCQDAIGKAGGKYFAARHGAIAGCYAALLAGKPIFEDPGHSVPITDPANCTDELKTAAKIDKGRRALRLAVEKKCSDTILDRLIACSQTVDGLVDPSGASGCLVLSIDAAVSDLLVDEYGL